MSDNLDNVSPFPGNEEEWKEIKKIQSGIKTDPKTDMLPYLSGEEKKKHFDLATQLKAQIWQAQIFTNALIKDYNTVMSILEKDLLAHIINESLDNMPEGTTNPPPNSKNEMKKNPP